MMNTILVEQDVLDTLFGYPIMELTEYNVSTKQ
jgi:hypothetical protein